jgi:hypothetical protein
MRRRRDEPVLRHVMQIQAWTWARARGMPRQVRILCLGHHLLGCRSLERTQQSQNPVHCNQSMNEAARIH